MAEKAHAILIEHDHIYDKVIASFSPAPRLCK